MKKLLSIIALISATACTTAFAQTASLSSDTAAINFINKATVGNVKEIKSGQLAARKGRSLSVKAYGTRMVTDHTKANLELSKISRSKGYTPPVPASTETAPDAMLTGATGATFDKNYVTMMVQDHKMTIALFENAAANVQDASVKAFAVKTLPKLRQHLASIQSIAANMGLATQ